jgi:hypothetical protein
MCSLFSPAWVAPLIDWRWYLAFIENSPLQRNLSINLLYLAQSLSTQWSLEGPARLPGGSWLGRGSDCSSSLNFRDLFENDLGSWPRRQLPGFSLFQSWFIVVDFVHMDG